MASAAMLALEGVLANHQEQPISHGVLLYHALREQYHLMIVTEWDEARADRWLRLQGLTGHGQLIARADGDEVGVSLRRDQLHRLRAMGQVVDLVIDSNPLVIAMAMYEGATGLLFAHPLYIRPEHRPDIDKRPRPWDEIVREQERQRLAYEDDQRRSGRTVEA